MNKDIIKSFAIYIFITTFALLFSFPSYGISVDSNGFKYNLCKNLFNSKKHTNNIFLEPITTSFNPFNYVGMDLNESLNYAISVLVYDYKKQLDSIAKIKLKDISFGNTIRAMERARTKIYNLYQILELLENIGITFQLSDESKKLLSDLPSYEETMFFDRIRRIYKKYSNHSSLTKKDHDLLEKYYHKFDNNFSKKRSYSRKQLEQKYIQEELSSTKETLERFLTLSKKDSIVQYHLPLQTQNDLDDMDLMYPLFNLKSRINTSQSNELYIDLSLMELSYILFFSNNETIRKNVFNIISTSSINDIQYDFITGKIFRLSHRYSKLNGYSSYSDFVLHDNTRFNDLTEIYNMLKVSLRRLNKKIRTSNNSLVHQILNTEPYNYFYTLNKIKQEINVSSQIFRYLETNSVINGVIEVFEKVFRVKFLQQTSTPSNIRIYDIVDKNTNTILSTIYMNLFTSTDETHTIIPHDRYLSSFKIIRPKTTEFYPIFQLNLNLTTYINPTTHLDTIMFNDIFSLFHELGYCFYFQSLEPSYFALKDNFDYKDFLEYPSIFMEQLARNRDIAKIYLRDYESNQPIDDGLLSRILDIKGIEYFTSRIFQLITSYVDIKSYSTNFDSINTLSLDTEEFLNTLSKQIQFFETFPKVLRDQPYVRFNTMFSDFYAAKCYIYTLAYNLTEYSIEEDILTTTPHILDFNIKGYLQNIYKDPNAFIDRVLKQY